MGLRIHTNVYALTVGRNLNRHLEDFAGHVARISSGLRIQSAADDPAGLSISEHMRARVLALKASVRQVENVVGLSRQAELVTNDAIRILGEMRALAVAGMDETLSNDDRLTLTTEFQAKFAEIQRLGRTTYNGNEVVRGITFSVFAGTGPSAEIAVVTPNFRQPVILALGNATLMDPVRARNIIPYIEGSTEFLTIFRGVLGGALSRLEHVHASLDFDVEATTISESRIRDADLAVEVSGLTRAQVLQSAGVALLGQANVLPENALVLLEAPDRGGPSAG